MTRQIEAALATLGKSGRDRVTGQPGVITSVSFDLYGCVQVILNPGVGPDGKIIDSSWYDLVRIEIDEKKPPVLANPFLAAAAPEKGPESKPAPRQS